MGEVAIGGYNKERMQNPDEIDWVPVEFPGYWLIAMDQVTFGDTVLVGRTGAIMDTGTSLIYGPASQVISMADAIGAELIPEINLFNIPCDVDIPDLEFKILGQAYTVPGNELKIGDDDFCFFSISIMDIGKQRK